MLANWGANLPPTVVIPSRRSSRRRWSGNFNTGATAPVVASIVLVPRRWGCYDRTIAEAIAFDTHRFVKRLTESGFTEKQAETLAEEHVALLNANLATKADVAKVEADIEALRQETKAAIMAVKADLVKWLFGAPIAQGGLIVALVKLL